MEKTFNIMRQVLTYYSFVLMAALVVDSVPVWVKLSVLWIAFPFVVALVVTGRRVEPERSKRRVVGFILYLVFTIGVSYWYMMR